MENQFSSKKSTLEAFKMLSLHLPLVLLFGLFVFSIMSATLQKFLFYVVVVLLIIMFRLVVHKFSDKVNYESLPEDCYVGMINEFIPQDVLFGTYLLSFTLFYFLTPMILLTIDSNLNSINYILLLFFMCYIFLDLAIKKQIGCTKNISYVSIIGNFFSGTLLGSGLSAILYTSPARNLLYVSEVNSNKEVCSVPTQQKFKCRVYKNGELVGSTVS